MNIRRRLIALSIATALAFAAIAARLAVLQLVEGERWARIAADTLRRTEPIRARRGRILDRNGRVLALDQPVYRLAVEIEDLDPGAVLPARIARVLRRPRAALERHWRDLERLAEAAPDGPPLALAEAPSATSEKIFRRIAAGEEGLFLEGRTLFAERALLLRRTRGIERIARFAALDAAELRARIEAETERALRIENPLERLKRLRRPLVVAPAVDFDLAARAEERARELPGLLVEAAFERRYPFGATGGQVLGWVGREEGPFPDEYRGRAGVEAACDDLLAGKHGARLVERDRKTRDFRVLEKTPPVPGQDLVLTIDIDIQRAAEESLDRAVREGNGGEHGGALVVLDVETGEVLALATAPRFDPNTVRRDFASLQAPPFPMIDRAIAAALPPGSTMKPLMAAAALEEKISLDPGGVPIGPGTEVFCRGYLHDPRVFRCDARLGHGPIALEAALARSCNVYFYMVGERLGEARLEKWAHRFGLGEPTGIDLPGERPGLIPSGEWKRRRLYAAGRRIERGERNLALAAGAAFGALFEPAGVSFPLFSAALAEADERAKRLETARAYFRRAARDAAFTTGDARNFAIGQGDVLATPIQMALAAGVIATGGRRLEPRVVRAPFGRAPSFREPVPLSPATLDAVRAGMRAVVSSPFGTAHRAGLEPFRVAGKTGTAQAGAGRGDHAWFMGFAPAEAPRVAFACLVEHVRPGLAGGDVAAPAIARVLGALLSSPRPLSSAESEPFTGEVAR
jgi:penicillin-binding protein 2